MGYVRIGENKEQIMLIRDWETDLYVKQAGSTSLFKLRGGSGV